MAAHLDTSEIKTWKSIVTLVVFVATNIAVLVPFHIPIYVPLFISNAILNLLAAVRIISPTPKHDRNDSISLFKRFDFPINFITAPLIADLFLLAILAIGRKEVHDGIIGATYISPIDIMVFFISLAYIAISIDASGLIRYMAFKVLQWGGNKGKRLFVHLYVLFFALGSFVGNDPIVLSGTAFLAYMIRASSNIVHPRAWIRTQFAVANIASAILVSSNPTNLVLAGAFKIQFFHYTANMIVPVLLTAVVMLPFLMYVVFPDDELIPSKIEMVQLPAELLGKKAVNPNIPYARGVEEPEDEANNNEEGKLLSLEEIINPFLDKRGAAFGTIIMAVTLATLLALNAASVGGGHLQVFWVTLPAAATMLAWDLTFGWLVREKTGEIAESLRKEAEKKEAEKKAKADAAQASRPPELLAQTGVYSPNVMPENANESYSELGAASDIDGISIASLNDALEVRRRPTVVVSSPHDSPNLNARKSTQEDELRDGQSHPTTSSSENESRPSGAPDSIQVLPKHTPSTAPDSKDIEKDFRESELEENEIRDDKETPKRQTLVSLSIKFFNWSQVTFPTATAVMVHLPFALVPFAFSMFVLVQALVTRGWVPVFAYGWDHWVNKTGFVGAIGVMGFLSCILCNFAGTNIGTTILLSRVIQAWEDIHSQNGITISDRTFWATVYSMAIGVNYGAFSAVCSASLAGLLWRDILARRRIHVKGLDFARVNLPIIALAMTVGLVVLVVEVRIFRDDKKPYSLD